jgi:hypothetical protein
VKRTDDDDDENERDERAFLFFLRAVRLGIRQ